MLLLLSVRRVQKNATFKAPGEMMMKDLVQGSAPLPLDQGETYEDS